MKYVTRGEDSGDRSVQRETIAGIPFVSTTPRDAPQIVLTARPGSSVHFANAYTIALADGDRPYFEVFQAATFVFPDGKPLTWIARLRRRRLDQIRGPEFFHRTLITGASDGTRHFLLGSDEATLSSIKKRALELDPRIQICGTLSPPYRTLSADERLAQDTLIRAAGPDVVWVGLGTPKQDYEVQRLARELKITAIAVGAAFNFFAGTVKEAPHWVRSSGLEWLFRLILEPRRLWRRYLVGNPRFIRAVVRRR